MVIQQSFAPLFALIGAKGVAVSVSIVSVAELRCGVEPIHCRGDTHQANEFEKWLVALLTENRGLFTYFLP